MIRENTHTHKVKNKRGQVQLQQNQLPIPSHWDRGGVWGRQWKAGSARESPHIQQTDININTHTPAQHCLCKQRQSREQSLVTGSRAGKALALALEASYVPKAAALPPPSTESHRGQPGFPGVASILKHSGSWDTTAAQSSKRLGRIQLTQGSLPTHSATREEGKANAGSPHFRVEGLATGTSRALTGPWGLTQTVL